MRPQSPRVSVAGAARLRPRRRRTFEVVGLLAALVLGQSCICPNMAARNAANRVIERETSRYLHAGSREEVLAAIDDELRARGFVTSASEGDDARTTEWKGSESSRERMRIKVSERRGGLEVRATLEGQWRGAETWTTEPSARDVELERAVIARIDAERAKALSEAEVEAFEFEVDFDALADHCEEAIEAHAGGFVALFLRPGEGAKITDWYVDADGRRRRRYAVEISPRGARLGLAIRREAERKAADAPWEDTRSDPDARFELEVIARRDPSRAEAIKAEAEAAATESHARAEKRRQAFCAAIDTLEQ